MPSAAILSGGRASRFGGRDKSTLIFDGRSIVERQLAELSQLTGDIVIVGGQPSSSLRGQVVPRLVPDRVAGCGPMGGLEAALAAARSETLVVIACDMPFVTAAFLGYLLTLAHEADAVVPRTERRYHPLCAVYHRRCGAAVTRCLAEHRLAMTDLLEDVHVRVVRDEEVDTFGDRNRLLANVNTPTEFAELEALQRHKS